MFNSQSLEMAWKWRERAGLLASSAAIRIFHGPGEGRAELAKTAIDRFGDHYWVTFWQTESQSKSEAGLSEEVSDGIVDFLKSKGGKSAVIQLRPEKGTLPEPVSLFGNIPQGQFIANEGPAKYYIQMEKTRHPGLFLDHAPLRNWLMTHMKGMKVLNTFAYTGSLSVAAGLGGAERVVTLDLSRPSVQWAEKNWALNDLAPERGRFIFGDVFEWLPRLKKNAETFDCVILDPPSFSRGKKGSFSTSSDLEQLHKLALELLSPDGFLVTSINSAGISWSKYEADVGQAARKLNRKLIIAGQIDLPETFPSPLGQPMARYLKGWILKGIA